MGEILFTGFSDMDIRKNKNDTNRSYSRYKEKRVICIYVHDSWNRKSTGDENVNLRWPVISSHHLYTRVCFWSEVYSLF